MRDSNGEQEIVADHVIAGTGYEVDVDRIAFISQDLARRIGAGDRRPGFRHFESSVPGLYFIGPIAAASFGPLVRFVAGSDFAVGALARRLTLQSLWRRVTTVKPAPMSVAPSTERMQPHSEV